MRLIDADWVMNALTVYGQSYDYVSVGRVTEVIENAPTIDAEPVRRGRWLTEYGDHIHAGLRPMFICCSECGMVTTVKWNYCSNCGAKMEENR